MTDTPELKRARAPLDARAIAKRNSDTCGKTLSPVMKAAATACEVAEPPPVRRSVAPRGETD